MGSSARVTVALAALFAVSGCGSASGVVAEKAADTMDSVEYEIAWIVHSMNGLTASTTPEEAVNASAAQAGDFWTDGCYMFSIDGPSITYDLIECSGPFDIAQLTGTVTITYNDMGAGVGFEIVASGLLIREDTLSFMVTAEVSTDGRNVSVTSNANVLGRRGHQIARDGSYNLQWNPSSECAGIDTGSWNTTVQGELFTTAVSNWRRCGASCPAAGSVTFSSGGAPLTLEYNGTNEATWTAADGGTGTTSLFCGG